MSLQRPGGVKSGALLGLIVGLIVLGGVFVVATACLPLHISSLPQPWPWYCVAPANTIIAFLAFPVNLLTDDLSQAVYLAPIALVLYTLAGALIGAGMVSLKRPPANRSNDEAMQ